jgi:hypothetical protein
MCGGDMAFSNISSSEANREWSLLLAESLSPIGSAVNAEIRDNLETCAVERGANTSYETFPEVDDDE